jgi:hypothetical protein
MANSAKPGSRVVPVVAGTLAVGYLLAATLAPMMLPPVTVATMVAASAVVLTRRRSRGLALTLAVVGAWLALGFAGALFLRDGPRLGLIWIVVTLFVLPLPAIPLVYWLTSSSVPGPRSPVPGAGGGAA